MALTLEQQLDLLMQGTDYGDATLAATMRAELRAKLQEGRPLRVYCGYDPRTADLHIGHTITMRKLRQFQDLGHQVIFLIGSYTSLVGDPSDKDKTRPVLTLDEVNANAATYTEQAFKVLDREKTTVRHNGEWLSELSLVDFIRIAQSFTVQQMLARENFAKRHAAGDAIYLQETFYPLMQGYDAVALQTDVQIGGSDQLFNIITAGRKLQESFGQKPQVGIIMGILPGTDGVVKMSKSLGNHIPLNSDANDMYGKVMSVPDFAMPAYFRLASSWLPAKIAAMEAALNDGSQHPRDIKMALAHDIAGQFYGSDAADTAQGQFIQVFQQRALPDDIPDHTPTSGQSLVDIIVDLNFAASKGEARRLIQQSGVKLDNDPATDINLTLTLDQPVVLQVGKRRFARLLPPTH